MGRLFSLKNTITSITENGSEEKKNTKPWQRRGKGIKDKKSNGKMAIICSKFKIKIVCWF